ncbi:hypothetical protein LNA01_19920 [Companilactobacillus nantensis]|nr:hypothetical protein LNA01_19920 [Companilactobacillus nantensis]
MKYEGFVTRCNPSARQCFTPILIYMKGYFLKSNNKKRINIYRYMNIYHKSFNTTLHIEKNMG